MYKVYGLPKFWQHFDPFLYPVIICNHYDVIMVEVQGDDYCLLCQGWCQLIIVCLQELFFGPNLTCAHYKKIV